MKFAYADPPYIGCAWKYRKVDNAEASEVDHAALISRLSSEYPDGWALSSHGKGLREILLACPPDVRVAAWVNTAAAPHAAERVIPAWEPVFYRSARRLRGRWGEPSITNALVLPGGTGRASERFLGAKPDAFTFWVLGLLGVEEGDTVDDLFPGSGAVGQAIGRFLAQRNLGRSQNIRPGAAVRAAIRRGHQPVLVEVGR